MVQLEHGEFIVVGEEYLTPLQTVHTMPLRLDEQREEERKHVQMEANKNHDQPLPPIISDGRHIHHFGGNHVVAPSYRYVCSYVISHTAR